MNATAAEFAEAMTAQAAEFTEAKTLTGQLPAPYDDFDVKVIRNVQQGKAWLAIVNWRNGPYGIGQDADRPNDAYMLAVQKMHNDFPRGLPKPINKEPKPTIKYDLPTPDSCVFCENDVMVQVYADVGPDGIYRVRWCADCGALSEKTIDNVRCSSVWSKPTRKAAPRKSAKMAEDRQNGRSKAPELS